MIISSEFSRQRMEDDSASLHSSPLHSGAASSALGRPRRLKYTVEFSQESQREEAPPPQEYQEAWALLPSPHEFSGPSQEPPREEAPPPHEYQQASALLTSPPELLPPRSPRGRRPRPLAYMEKPRLFCLSVVSIQNLPRKRPQGGHAPSEKLGRGSGSVLVLRSEGLSALTSATSILSAEIFRGSRCGQT